jgi:hypothetical protein
VGIFKALKIHHHNMFIDIKQRVNLKLVETKKFSSGVVQLCYHLNEK